MLCELITVSKLVCSLTIKEACLKLLSLEKFCNKK